MTILTVVIVILAFLYGAAKVFRVTFSFAVVNKDPKLGGTPKYRLKVRPKVVCDVCGTREPLASVFPLVIPDNWVSLGRSTHACPDCAGNAPRIP